MLRVDRVIFILTLARLSKDLTERCPNHQNKKGIQSQIKSLAKKPSLSRLFVGYYRVCTALYLFIKHMTETDLLAFVMIYTEEIVLKQMPRFTLPHNKNDNVSSAWV
jgi:hypothetical protein